MVPHWGSVICGGRLPKRHIYDISANNPCFLRANLMFYVGCSRKTKQPPPKHRKSHFFDPHPPTRKKSGIFYDGHKLAVALRDSTPKSAVFSVRRWSNGLSTHYKQTKSHGFAAWGRQACYRRPHFLVGSLADVVLLSSTWPHLSSDVGLEEGEY